MKIKLVGLTVSFVMIFCFISGSALGQANKTEGSLKVLEHLVGDWELVSVYSGNKEIPANQENALTEISFDAEGKYKSPSGEGSYRMNENHAILYLENDTHYRKPTEWRVSFTDEGYLLMTREQEPDIRYVYQRGDYTASPEN